MFKKLAAALSFGFPFALICGPAEAAITTFADRTAFQAAANPTLFEDFGDFASDTDFAAAPLAAGFITASASPGALGSGIFNKVDVPPYNTDESNVDGTASLNVYTRSGWSVFLTFTQALSSFGADFHAFNNGDLRTQIFIDGQEVPVDFAQNSATRFFGFTSDATFTSVEFRGIVDDVFSVDNVAGAIGGGAVPEPTTWAMMLLGFFGIGSAIRARRRRSNVVQQPLADGAHHGRLRGVGSELSLIL